MGSIKGKIIRGVGGFYYVHAQDGQVYECRAKGIFRKENVKPLPGDDVEMSVISSAELTGNVDRILPRKNMLIRPAAANVDQALVIFAAASPKPNLNLLDRFLILMRMQEIPVQICFNKTDLVDKKDCDELKQTYESCGCGVYFVSIEQQTGLKEVREMLEGKTTVVAGPSGVGKSSMTNFLLNRDQMEVGSVSERIDRGRHTTRHTELFAIGPSTYFLDTPGFSSLYLPDMTPEALRELYPEFAPYEGTCRFQGCMHISEPGCTVKEALAQGQISAGRYKNYCLLAEELKQRKPKYNHKA